jgi:hypothetical protein
MNTNLASSASTREATTQFVQAVCLLAQSLRKMVQENNAVMRHTREMMQISSTIRVGGEQILVKSPKTN